MKKLFHVTVLVALFGTTLIQNVAARTDVDQTSNVKRLSSFAYEKTDRPTMDIGGTDLAFDRSFVYAAEQGREGAGGGVHIYKTTPTGAKRLSSVPCGGWQNDVAVVKPGLIALGYHKGALNCGSKNGGITLIDVEDPKRPRILGSTPDAAFASSESFGGVHTITPFPGARYMFTSPGGLFTQATPSQKVVDVSDPTKPVIAAEIDTGLACHDITFWVGAKRTLGFCSGVGATQVWDMSDPLDPAVLASIANPHYFNHSNAVTADGSLLVIGTETLGNDCAGGPTGALLAYDVADPAVPLFKGFFGAPRGASLLYPGVTDTNFEQLCAPHLFNFEGETRTLVSGNGSGGISVVDFSDPSRPSEVAHYMSNDMPMVFSAYWHRGRVYANGLTSFDIFDIKL